MHTNGGAETQIGSVRLTSPCPKPTRASPDHHRQSPLCFLSAVVFLPTFSSAQPQTTCSACVDTDSLVFPLSNTVPSATEHTMKTCEPECSEGVLEVLLSLLLGLNSPQARAVQDFSGLQATLLLLLRDLLLEGGVQPPASLLHLIARMQKTHQRRQRRRQRAALRMQYGNSAVPLHLPSSFTSHLRPGREEPLGHPYTAFLPRNTAESDGDSAPDSHGTREDGRDDAARPRPS